MQRALLPEASPAQLDRLSDPTERTYISSTTGERVSEGPELIVQVIAPIALAIVFALAVFTGANQMGTTVVREKENRAMEMVVTSMSPSELVAGKILGMSLLSLTQVSIWVFGALIAVAMAISGASGIMSINIPWQPIIWVLLLGIPGYFLYAALGSGLGVIAGDSQQARQLSGYLGMLGLFPLYFTAMIVNAPNGALAIGLTLFPLTAPMMSLLRMAMTTVPVWQLFASLGLILVCLVAAIWSVARIFRVTMLLYGQSLNPKQLLEALKAA
jgi:ABC-2 type transport system permease protein